MTTLKNAASLQQWKKKSDFHREHMMKKNPPLQPSSEPIHNGKWIKMARNNW